MKCNFFEIKKKKDVLRRFEDLDVELNKKTYNRNIGKLPLIFKIFFYILVHKRGVTCYRYTCITSGKFTTS